MKPYVRRYISFFEFLLLFGIMVLVLRCEIYFKDDSNIESKMPIRDINEVMEAHTKELMAIPGVVGVYIGALDDGMPCIKVMVIEKTLDLEQKIPEALEGHPIVIDETGEIRPL